MGYRLERGLSGAERDETTSSQLASGHTRALLLRKTWQIQQPYMGKLEDPRKTLSITPKISLAPACCIIMEVRYHPEHRFLWLCDLVRHT